MKKAKRQRSLRLIGLFITGLISLCSLTSVHAQTFPGATEEKRATPKNPAYKPSSIPPYLKNRNQQDSPAQRFFRNPDNQSVDDPARAVEIQRPKHQHALGEARLETEFKNKQDRTYIERTYLPQFGWRIDPDTHNPFYGEPEYTETRFERGRNIFLLSSPFTFGLSYAMMAGYRRSQGLPTGLDGPQTAAVVGLGTLLSGLIVWYDYRRVWKPETARIDRFARELQAGRR